MAKTRITQAEWDALIRKVEEKTHFRYAAGTTDGSLAFMIPVSDDGTALASAQPLTLTQLRALAKLPPRPKA